MLDAKQFAAYHQRLATQLMPTLLRGVRSGAARAVDYLVKATRAAPPANPRGVGSGGAVNTGNLVRRYRAIPLPDGAGITNDSSYWPIVEYGRRPGKFPPRADLVAWIRRRVLAKPAPRRRSKSNATVSDKERAARDQKRLDARIRKFARGEESPGRRAPQRRQEKPGRRRVAVADQAERLYFPIARAIARRGLIGRRVLTAPTAQQEILTMVTREVATEINRELSTR